VLTVLNCFARTWHGQKNQKSIMQLYGCNKKKNANSDAGTEMLARAGVSQRLAKSQLT
jgi:hypothetical protein